MPVHKELCVGVRKYKGSDGKEKTEWQNIGRIIEKDDGGKFMVLKPYINLAGLPRTDSGDVMVAMFDPKNGDNSNQKQSRPQLNNDPDDDIPF